MSFFDWMLAFHLLSAFAVAAALVLFSVMVFSGRRMTTLEETRTLFRVAPIGNVADHRRHRTRVRLRRDPRADSDTFNIWDGWVIAGIVLWAALRRRRAAQRQVLQRRAEAREQDGTEAEVLARLRASTGALLHLATVALFVLILLDMIFKPGA